MKILVAGATGFIGKELLKKLDAKGHEIIVLIHDIIIKYNQLNSETFLLPMVDGELVLFPSSLRHAVPINKGNDTRYSMSFNTFCIDELGSKDSLTHLNIKALYE